MAINLVNRYKQLLSTIPKGSFYDSAGQILPYRGNSPYELRITTSVPNRQYGVFINDQYTTLVTTNASNVALLNVKLNKGRNDIRLVDAVTQDATLAYVTTRDYATLLAAEAQVTEGIDTGVEQVLLDSHLETSSVSLIEAVFGKTVDTGNSFGYDLDTYRELLGEIRTAYRYWGGTTDGIARVVRAFTQNSPLIYRANFGPVWLLGKDILSPKHSTTDRTYYSTSSLATINAGGAGISIDSISNTVGVGTGTIKSYSVFGVINSLSWTPPGGTEGPQVVFVGFVPQTQTLYGGVYFDKIIGVPGPYNISAPYNDVFSMDVDGHGAIDIQLTAGAVRTATQIAADINAVLAADLRYGGSFNAVADSYDAFGSGTPMIRLTSPNNQSIKLIPRGGPDATQTLFNLPAIRGGLSVNHAFGASAITLSSDTDMNSWPIATPDDPLMVVVGGTLFHPTGTPHGTAVVTSAELVAVTNVNVGTKTLTLANTLTIAHHQFELAYVVDEWPYVRNSVANSRSINATVNVPANIIDAVSSSVVVDGTGAPDGWVITTNAGNPVTPIGFVKHTYFEADRDIAFDVNADGMVSIPVPAEVLNYKGFDVVVSFWGRIDDPSRAATQSTINSIDVSFDDQATYNRGSPTVSGLAINAQYRPREYLRTIRVPPSATRMWIRASLSASGVGNFTIHKVRVTVPHAHSGLFLGSGTIPRVENKIKQGSFMYVWSPDTLSTYEDSSLGLTNITQVNPGHIDKIAPAEAWLEKFDVTEYDGSGVPINLRGVFDEVDWSAGTATNCTLILRTPSRFSYMKPELVSDVTQVMAFSATPAYVGTLTIASDQDLLTSVLLADGVPLTQDEWHYNSASQIELTSAPSATAAYSFQYQALIKFESATIDLGASFADYVWFADYHVWLRPEIVTKMVSIKTGISFDSTGRATLSERSNQDKSKCTLTEDLGLSKRIVPQGQWSFVDARRVQINVDVYNPNGLYELRYTAEVNHPSTDATCTVEIKSASTVPGLVGATWSAISHNQVVDGSLRYHQMRVTLLNIRDLRDARIQSLNLKGLNMFGSGTVPVLRP